MEEGDDRIRNPGPPWAAPVVAVESEKVGLTQCISCMCVISASRRCHTLHLGPWKRAERGGGAENSGTELQVLLYGMMPPIAKMDNTLSALKACKHLSLSSNNIERVTGYSKTGFRV